jgi:hypothetical protein
MPRRRTGPDELIRPRARPGVAILRPCNASPARRAAWRRDAGLLQRIVGQHHGKRHDGVQRRERGEVAALLDRSVVLPMLTIDASALPPSTDAMILDRS